LARWKFFRLIRGFNINVKSADILRIFSVAISDHKKKKKVIPEDIEKVEKKFKKGNKYMKISFPLMGFNVSGGIRIIINIANGLNRKGYSVCIIVPDYASVSPFELEDSIEKKIISTKGKGIWRKLFYYLILCFVSTQGCDVAFATGYKTPYCLFLSKLIHVSSVRLFYMVQGYEPLSHVQHSVKNKFIKNIFYIIAKFSFKVPMKKITVSSWIKDQIGDNSIKVINNGVDLNVFLPNKKNNDKTNRFVIGTVGRSAKYKGYDIFLKAISSINDKEIEVLVLSQDDLKLPNKIKGRIIKPNNDTQVVDFYHQCDIFVLSSFIEGFPLPPLEAMACGVPVVTTDCGGIRDFVNNSNSIIVPTGDVHSIASAVIMLKKDKNFREGLRERGLETAKKYSLEIMIERYCQYLNKAFEHE